MVDNDRTRRERIMAHRTAKSGYDNLVERLNRAPQGAPPSRLLNRILAMLMNDKSCNAELTLS